MNPNAEAFWVWMTVSLFILGCWKLVEVVGWMIKLLVKRGVEQAREIAALKASAERATEEQERKEPRLGVIGGR